MALFMVDRDTKEKKLKQKKLQVDGYKITPKWHTKNDLIEVKEITIASPELQANYFCMQFHITFRKLFKKACDVMESDDATTSDTMLVLNETEKIKRILKEKFKRKLSQKEYRHMLQKVEMVEQQLREKLVFQRNMEFYMHQVLTQTEEREKGRGR